MRGGGWEGKELCMGIFLAVTWERPPEHGKTPHSVKLCNSFMLTKKVNYFFQQAFLLVPFSVGSFRFLYRKRR